jgi:hypothetical protein
MDQFYFFKKILYVQNFIFLVFFFFILIVLDSSIYNVFYIFC